MDRPADPTPAEATVANANLWAAYLEQQWRGWLNPLGLPTPEIVESTAARVASFLTLVVGGPIARMYQENAPSVTPSEPARLTREPAKAGSDSVAA